MTDFLDDLTEEEMLLYVMPFGMYKGRVIRDVPTTYLRYIKSFTDLDDTLVEILEHFETEIETEPWDNEAVMLKDAI